MGTNTLNTRASGDIIVAGFFNDFNTALDGDFVGRNSSGVPTSGQNLGTIALPWGVARVGSLVINGSPIDTTQITSPQNRIISGKTRSASNQPAFIVPNGAAASFQLLGASVNLNFDVNGSTVAVTTDITKSSLTTAPASNNTCLVNDATAVTQNATRTWGEENSSQTFITVDNMGSGITSLVGKFAAFKIAGSATEYMIAFVESTTKLQQCRRGFFYDSTSAPVNRAKLTDNDVITLLSWGHVFVANDGTTVDVSYTPPTISVTAPSAPVTGDYFYDLVNFVWKRYDGASFVIINRTYVGSVIITTANCVGARCQDFYARHSGDTNIVIQRDTNAIAKSLNPWSSVIVHGNKIDFFTTFPTWNTSTDLVASPDSYTTLAINTIYYLYISDTGKMIISDIEPYNRADYFGLYHPHNPWRCVGFAMTDGSSNLSTAYGLFGVGPTVQNFTSGSGTYTTPPNVKYLRVRMVGAGGGGAGSGTGSSGGNGGTGGNTTFGTTLLAANGGVGGLKNFNGIGTGGSASLGTGPIGIALSGGAGGQSLTGGSIAIDFLCNGGHGAPSAFGGGGNPGSGVGVVGGAGSANTGGGGGGGGITVSGGNSGGGAGSGGFVDAIIIAPAPSYAYGVGAAGTAGTAGTSGFAGGAGAAGYISVTEIY